MSNLKVRHFILGEDFELDGKNTFSAKGVYEYFSAPSFPSLFTLHGILGIYFLQLNEKYNVEIHISQDETLIGKFIFDGITVDKPNEIMNFVLRAEFSIPNEGFVQFDILVNGKFIDTQIVQAIQEA